MPSGTALVIWIAIVLLPSTVIVGLVWFAGRRRAPSGVKIAAISLVGLIGLGAGIYLVAPATTSDGTTCDLTMVDAAVQEELDVNAARALEGQSAAAACRDAGQKGITNFIVLVAAAAAAAVGMLYSSSGRRRQSIN
ncbi:hypothetical protein GCM10022263_37290 [Nocardioides daeguensis]|uniref:Uncharacterized protein n=2 Tax=Nocardioides daeguensis TaxID=908359 RepID=A0ABP6WB36_9ACTN